jgi:uncharacterized membrane protein YgcG
MREETRLAWRALTLAGSLAALALTGITGAADEWGPRSAGQHVYDTAHVLSAAQVSDLEASAAAVDRAGAPTVVYVRLRAADDPTTRRDARALMDAWSVESAAGARDGLVLLINLRPTDARHGSAALVAGASHAGDGRLADGRLQSIYGDVMKPHLARGDLAAALSAALAAVRDDLATPPATPAPLTAQDYALAPLGLAIIIIPIGVVVLVVGLVITAVQRMDWSRGSSYRSDGDQTSQLWYTSGSVASGSAGDATGDSGASSDSSSGGGDF